MHAGVLVGYFGSQSEARKAFSQLWAKGYRRSASVSRSVDGEIHRRDPLPLYRTIGAVLAFVLLWALTSVVMVNLDLAGPGFLGSPWDLVAGLVGVVLSLAWIRRSTFGVDRELIHEHARLLVHGESLVILQAPVDTLQIAVAVLLENKEIQPAIFILYPKRERPSREEWGLGTVANPTQLGELAHRLAANHRLSIGRTRSLALLKQIEQGRRWVHHVCLDLTVANRLEQSVSPAAEWLLDNEYIVEGNSRKVLLNLPRRYYRQLPSITGVPDGEQPRIYDLARQLVSASDLRVDQETILAFITAYQVDEQLSIGELWSVPQMLRVALTEGIQQVAERTRTQLRERGNANFWANRLIAVNRRDPQKIFSVLSELIKTQPAPSTFFAAQLIEYLYDEEAALAPVQSWLERVMRTTLGDLNGREKNRQIKDQISIGNAFTSLRQLDLLDWKVCFERLSGVEVILRQDPAGIYPQMDFATRDRCRRSIEALHRGSGMAEGLVARQVLDLAKRGAADALPGDLSSHVGTYLIGEGRAELAQLIRCRESLRYRALHWTYRHHSLVYFSGLALFTGSIISSAVMLMGPEIGDPILQSVAALLLLAPASQLALEVMNSLVMWLLPPRTLPKMDYSTAGIPDRCRTLVVVPMMLVDPETVQGEIDKLEIRYLANKEHNLIFSLFSDYTDAAEMHCATDEALLQCAKDGIAALNQRCAGNRFFLLHRGRTWSESERSFIGWERKRGKLEELNGLINGTRSPDAEALVQVGDPEQLSGVRYVITLDTDTQLPTGTARRMIETLSHPLNQAQCDSQGRIQTGYTIIQPRVGPTLTSMCGTPFSRLFSDPAGIDPYTAAVSDVNQDLAGEGSYHGKGIYDVRAFSRVVAGRFPEAWLLSHDLIEGAHGRVGLASDIELYDEFPQDYLSFVKRQHRWIRGDWQIADWIMPQVPKPDGAHGSNPLTWFDRWKIFDNLRRSLLPLSIVSLLAASWCMSMQAGWIAAVIVSTQLLFHSLAQQVTWATNPSGSKGVSVAKLMHDLLRVLAKAALLPYQAWLATDAVVRVLYRKHISHRMMLEWTSAQTMHGRAQANVPKLLSLLGVVSVCSLVVGWTVMTLDASKFWLSSPWLFLWFLSPVFGWILNMRPQAKQALSELKLEDRTFLRFVACRTWRYFQDFVGEESSWLPPDNYQVSYQNQLAMRTSPTNIGLWMVSVLGAHDFGYITGDEAIFRLSKTMETIAKLERHEGHLLNWYDTRSLAPLKPRYVSTVDSGNLLAALWSLDHGISELPGTALLDSRAMNGLRDTAESLRRAVLTEKFSGSETHTIHRILLTLESTPERIQDTIAVLRQVGGEVGDLAPLIGSDATAGSRVTYWAKQLQTLLKAWLNIVDRYLAWIEILGEKNAEGIALLDPGAVPSYREALRGAPSLECLASANLPWVRWLRGIQHRASSMDPSVASWIDRLFKAFDDAKWLAGEMLASSRRLDRDIQALAESIDMRLLYDPGRRLFSIGYNVTEGRLDHAYYDLLASEARLGSFVAIARGDVPSEHWFALSRPYGGVGRRTVLLSWTGTMFEYLMPLLFQRAYDNSLLNNATREAVAVQIAYGRKHDVPWGISESASGDLDLNKTYQYSAFGVPALGLKRGLEEKIVVAPYATLLAITLAPRRSVRNLRRLEKLGLLGEYGYYDSMDFSQQPMHEGEQGVAVRTFMAHHQGMAFLALVNLLHDNAIQNRFHQDPRVRAVEALLQERIPHLPPLNQMPTRARVSSIAAVGEIAPSVSQFETPNSPMPKTQLLSNGRYRLMVTNAGGGYSQWGDCEITRWKSDRTCDSWGTFCYIHDRESNRLWCNTYQPTVGKVEDYSADFSLDRAVFRRTDNGIESETEIIVAPEDDVEIRRMTFINRSLRTRRLDITSYVELSLAPHNADRQHPAFNKLFIQTEAIPGERAVIAFRRLRHDNDPPIYVGHRFTFEEKQTGELRFETDRLRFIGRGRTLAAPMGAVQEPGKSQGLALDPILSLRESLTLAAGQRIQLSMVLAGAATREQLLTLLDKYSTTPAIERAMDFAWTSAQLELQILRIQPDDARRFQQLASHMVYPSLLLRSPVEVITENRKGQSGLWAHGISGDLPIALAAIGETQDLSLVRQILKAHSYWHAHGLTTDLVILNEETPGYEHPLQEQLERLIQTHSAGTAVNKPGGIFLRNADTISTEDLTLLRAAACVVVVAARGNIHQQLGFSPELPDTPGLLPSKRDPRDPSAALPFMELSYFNSIGGFTPEGREYAVYLGPGINTPMPWINVIANPHFGCLVSETGAGFTWQGNSQRNRLTQWSNDPVTDPPGETLYIRDEETGIFWTPCAQPIREETAYRARHGAGYTVFEHNSHGIEQELTVFVPVNENGGEPVKLQRLLLKNDSRRPRRISVTYYVEWTLGEFREASQMHIITNWDDDVHAVFARNCFNPDFPEHIAFAAISLPAESHTGDRTAFLGRNRSMKNPAAMEQNDVSGQTGAGLDPCAGLQTVLWLAPGGRADVTCILGQAPSMDAARALVNAYRKSGTVVAALEQSKSWWDARLGTITVRTPELAVDLLVNRWLLYQTLGCRFWGRSAFYQSGGAFGFRDQLQDVMGLLYASPEEARRHILLASSRQFTEGDVQHWWHAPKGAGVRTRISDDLLWLPFVVAQYVRITGDAGILHEVSGFLESPALEKNQNESFQTPDKARERVSLFEHCQRAVQKGFTAGVHGLPLIGSGDWNDGMNLVGIGGKGESVWLAWFLTDVLRGMSELSERMGRHDLSLGYLQERKALIERVERFAWDGAWYLRATFDDGTPIGSSSNVEARIDSIPQSWAWLSDAAEKERANTALHSAWDHLVREDEGLVLLFEPPFDTTVPSPGYIMGYPPGVRENGGQYTHAAVWLAMALARSGDGTRADAMLRMLNPIEHARDPESIWRYGIEPYVAAADVYCLPGRMGRGGWSWYTGSAAWMYRAWVEEVLGLHVRGETMTVNPVIPAWWDGFQLSYRHGEAIYDISVENPEHCEREVLWVELDGQRMCDGVITLGNELVKHRVIVHMGKS